MLKKVAGAKPAATYEHHMCPQPGCHHTWDELEPARWQAHRDDVCPFCRVGRRFLQMPGPPRPSKRYWTPQPRFDHSLMWILELGMPSAMLLPSEMYAYARLWLQASRRRSFPFACKF